MAFFSDTEKTNQINPKTVGKFFSDSIPNISTTTPVTGGSTPALPIKTGKELNIPSTIGGVVGKLGDILSTGQFAATATAEKALKIKPEETFKEKFAEKKSFVDVLSEVGSQYQPQSALGKYITGTYDVKPGESISKIFVKELPHTVVGIAADILLDPISLLAGSGIIKGATIKTLGVAGKALEKARGISPLVEKGVQSFGKYFLTRFGQPELFQALDKARKAEESMIATDVGKIVEPVIKESMENQRKIYDIIIGSVPVEKESEQLKILAEPIRAELDRVGESISKVNPQLLSEETFNLNKGKYFPRLFEKHEFPTEEQRITSFFKTKPVRIPGQRFMARKDLPQEVLDAMGEIKEAGFPAAKGLSQLRAAEIRGKFFKDVAENFASDLPAGNLVQLPETKLLGNLSNKFVSPAIADTVNQIVRVPTDAERLYGDALRLWKTFKTAYNPATLTRNDLTNYLVLNPLGSVNPWRLDIYAKTVQEWLSNGEIFQAARKAGLDISNQASAELLSRASAYYKANQGLISQFFSTVKDFHRTVVNFYGSQDKFFKLANIIKGVTEDGLTTEQALKRANFYLIDYSEVPKFVDWLRTTPLGAPFISFTYGVSKPLAKTLLERPDKLANYFKILRGIQEMNPYEDTKQQRLKEYNVLPDYIKQGQYLRLPIKDERGRTQYLDLQYILPFNPLESTPSLFGVGGAITKVLGQNPFTSAVADVIHNQSGFTGKEIYKTTDSEVEKNLKVGRYVWQQFAPSNPLIPESFSFEKMQDVGIFPRIADGKLVFQSRPDKIGAERSKIVGLLDTLFGIKLTPVELQYESGARGREIKFRVGEIKSELKSIMRNKKLLPQEKTQQKRSALESLKTIRTR